ncbi:uncharacterized protein BT62DRAFT_1071339 [Guyanagaster necrorhizus]|uniref:Uncharacterized protein n=1 Tax=Guyanagaster necrorhizus TaxID=856835 RepID=A0A9P7W4U7_9AGAR|nr:uncharacterized protein BT62DRAFT_1071339 [Guyanagaster necrorhizus MCA 3950]KAG7452168.1 hypothetical protein BT62DRAFT_1071339 [Guyanagaster necrorhizus MCA 3950]
MGDADYFTVSKPYPLNFEWDQEEDIIKHVRWIAACIDSPRQFYAFHYKRSASSMIVLEIEKNCSSKKETLLGEHRWKEFLMAPSDQERDYISQIFPCLHSTDLALRNDGWHRVSVRDSWFKGWSRTQSEDIIHPYPSTHYCIPPIEDRTNRPLCRPLPHYCKFKQKTKSDAKLSAGASGLRTQDHTNASEAPKQDEEVYEAGENIWEQNIKPSQTSPICPTHNRVCKKAICAAYDKLLRDIKKEEKNAKKGEKKKEHAKQYERKKNAKRAWGRNGGKGEESKTRDKTIDGKDETSDTWNSSWGDEDEQGEAGQWGKGEGSANVETLRDDGNKTPSPISHVAVEEEEYDPWV